MQKRIFFFLICFTLNCYCKAQEYKTCMGLRAGLPSGITAKHFMNREYSVEGILATRWGGYVLTGLFEREYLIKDYPRLNWFWGGGIHGGIWEVNYNPRIKSGYGGPVGGFDGILGLEYTFDELPLNVSADILPSLNIVGSTGWGGINMALSIRYVF